LIPLAKPSIWLLLIEFSGQANDNTIEANKFVIEATHWLDLHLQLESPSPPYTTNSGNMYWPAVLLAWDLTHNMMYKDKFDTFAQVHLACCTPMCCMSVFFT
jgi:hypothetical protein